MPLPLEFNNQGTVAVRPGDPQGRDDRFGPCTVKAHSLGTGDYLGEDLRQFEFRFVLAYSPTEFSDSLRHIAEGRIDVRPIITDTVGLSGVPDAFVALRDPESQCKIVIDPFRD